MGACTSKSEILRNAGEEDAPVEKEVVEVVANDAEVGEAKQQSLDNLLKDQEDDRVKDATKPAVADDEAQELTKNNEASHDEEKIVEAQEVIKAEASEQTKNVVSEEAEVIKTAEEPTTEENNTTEEEKPKPETSEAIKTEEKEEPKPLFKLWF